MTTAIDSAGRVVIPKVLRDALGLAAGQPLEIDERAYGALIAFTAAEHEATLLSLDQRAAAAYAAVVTIELLTGLATTMEA